MSAADKEPKMTMKIGDLIDKSINCDEHNTVNFKMVQTVLHILARQLRVLELRVEFIGEKDVDLEKLFYFDKATSTMLVRVDGAIDSVKGQEDGKKGKGKADDDAVSRGKKGKKDKEDFDTSKRGKRDEDDSPRRGKKADDDSPRRGKKTDDDSPRRGKKEKKEKDDDSSPDESVKFRGRSKDRKSEVESDEISKKKKKEDKLATDAETDKGKKRKHGRESTEGARSNIEVVTQREFEMLEEKVRELMRAAGPMPMPTMPDNATLRQELYSGSADLATTMNAMQVNARVQAAEAAISNLSDLLTQLAARGALPADVASKMEVLNDEMKEAHDFQEELRRKSVSARQSTMSKKMVGYEPSSMLQSDGGAPSKAQSMVQAPPGSAKSILKMEGPRVTQTDLKEIIDNATNDLKKQIHFTMGKAAAVADNASMTAKSVSERLEEALQLDSRIGNLYSIVNDYAEQLSGFDSGLNIQMQGFREQMNHIRGDLKAGLILLEQANNNAETAAVMELTERYQGIVAELEITLNSHAELSRQENQLNDHMKTLISTVEMMREDKADRDEVLDALRDKADSSRLAGLLNEAQFVQVTNELEMRLAACHDKFGNQEKVWVTALNDLSQLVNQKADVYSLLSQRDELDKMLQDLHCKLVALYRIVGEPKAAMLTRALSRGAMCAACRQAALMEAEDPLTGIPTLLPAARGHGAPVLAPPPTQRDECLADLEVKLQGEVPPHACLRWAGGSHTRLSRRGARPADRVTVSGPEARKYAAAGADGRLYMLEEPCLPCEECNKEAAPTPSGQGGGDQGKATTTPSRVTTPARCSAEKSVAIVKVE